MILETVYGGWFQKRHSVLKTSLNRGGYYHLPSGVLLKAGPRPSGPRPTARDGPAARRPGGPVAQSCPVRSALVNIRRKALLSSVGFRKHMTSRSPRS